MSSSPDPNTLSIVRNDPGTRGVIGDMATPDYDVAIVGGSLAGSTAATLYGRAGLRVALIEKHGDPKAYKVVCSHFIQASAVPTPAAWAQRADRGGGRSAQSH